MISSAAVGKVAKSSSLLMLLVVMTVVPLFVYSTLPRASAWNTTSQTSTSAATTTFSGRAFDAEITLPPAGPMFFVDTGSFSSSGFSHGVAAAPIVFPIGIGTADGLTAMTMGSGNIAHSMAAAGTLNIALPGLESLRITADLVSAESTATCTGVSGSATVTNLMVGIFGPFAVTVPNQPIPVPGLTIVANEQTISTAGGTNSITVNALHITSPTTRVDVIIASAHSDITCASSCHTGEDDFVMGSGEESDSSDQKSQMGFDAGHEGDMSTTSGHMTYVDHGAGVNVQSTDVTSYTIDAVNQRTFGGHANYNGAPGYTYQAIVQDNAERGTGLDTFSIAVFDPSSLLVYTHSGTLSSGDIKMHNSGNECD